MKYDFSKNFKNIARWEAKKDGPLTNDRSKKRTYFNAILSFPNKYPYSFYPPFLIFILTIIVNLASTMQLQRISNLEPFHKVYSRDLSAKNKISTDIQQMAKEIKVHKTYLEDTAPIYLFAFELQRITPKDIQLLTYNIDKNSFKMNARSYSLDAVNRFISLMSSSKIIEFSTIRLNGVKREGDLPLEGGSSGISQNSMLSVEISGLLKGSSLKNRFDLYKESGAYGLSKKSKRILDIKTSLNKSRRK